MKISRNDINSLYAKILLITDARPNKDGNIEKYNFGMVHALVRNKHKLKPHVEELAEQKKKFNEQSEALFLEHAKRDSDGKLEPIESGQFPEFDKARKELDKVIVDYLKEEIEFEPFWINKKYVPDMNATIAGAVPELCFIFAEPEKD
jgi:hypothetical protein